jgi:hypothetical protein
MAADSITPDLRAVDPAAIDAIAGRTVRVSTPVAEVFALLRDEINAAATTALRRSKRVTADDFSEVLAGDVAPIIEAVAAFQPEAVTPVTRAAVARGLELATQRLLGLRAYSTVVSELWRSTFPLFARCIAQQPGLIDELTNACVHLLQNDQQVARRWVFAMRGIGPEEPSVSELRLIGQVVAWTAGSPQYRSSALGVLQQLPAPFALRLVGADEDQDASSVVDELRADTWWRPGGMTGTGSAWVASVGSFAGWDGVFARPPVVSKVDGALVAWGSDSASADHSDVAAAVQSQPEVWQVFADAFGSAFIRTGLQPTHTTTALPKGCAFENQILHLDGAAFAFRSLGAITSAAQVGRTLAITTQRSHCIQLFRRGDAR